MRYLLLILTVSTFACTPKESTDQPQSDTASSATIQKVYAKAETDNAPSNDDAADDPAIFVHPEDRQKSVIIGTDKQYGLMVYNLEGKELHRFPFGATNNVDLRQGCVIGSDTVTIVAASNRSFNGLSLFALDHETYVLTPLNSDTLFSESKEVYGCTMYREENGQAYAFIIGKDGLIEQWAIKGDDVASATAEVVRTLQVPSQPEGGVVDDARGVLFIGEEAAGVWQFDASASGNAEGKLVVAIKDHSTLAADVEGIALYTTPEVQYLVVSSQGNHTYAIFSTDNFEFKGSFCIPFGEDIDGAEETDGIEVTSAALGSAFPHGLMVVQDGFNDGTQNFKYLDWADVAKALEPALVTEPQ